MKFTLRYCAVAASLLLSCMSVAHASPIKWRPGMVHVSVESRDLKDVLRDFAASQGIITTVAPSVQGTVSGRFDLPPRSGKLASKRTGSPSLTTRSKASRWLPARAR
jgi:type III secretion protein C